MFSVIWAFALLLLGFASGYQHLTEDELKGLDNVKDMYLMHPDNKDGYLQPILKVRIPDTPASKEVRDHFSTFFNELNDKKEDTSKWVVETDSFLDNTPTASNVNFTNFIATIDPPGKRPGEVGRLTLVAHYDSKIEPAGFLGAIDSAFPCALIMYVLKQLDDALTKKWATEKETDVGIQVLFLDGEEAFKDWTSTDSIYGARHLAGTWDLPEYSATSTRRSRLDSIDLFMLLDLLGARDPIIPSFYKHTNWAHENLGRLQHFFKSSSMSKASNGDWFPQPGQYSLAGQIGDDHLPFFDFGVPVLHLIPVPFPPTWHQITDDGEHLDVDTLHDWGLIMTAFVAEYMELSGYL